MVLVHARAHQRLGSGVAQGQAGEDGESGGRRPPGPYAQGQEHHGRARARRSQGQQGGGAQAGQGGHQAGAGEDAGGRHGLQLAHGGRAHVGEQDGLEQHLQCADGQGHEGHEGHEAAHAGPCRDGAPAAQEMVGRGGLAPLAGASTPDGAHDDDRAGHGHQAGGGVHGQKAPQPHQGQQEAGQQRGQQVAGGGGGLQHAGAAQVVLLVDQVGDGGAQRGLGQGRQAGGGRHARQDVTESGRGRAQHQDDGDQPEHGSAVADDHHEPAVEVVRQGSGHRGQEDDRGEGAQLDQGHG